MQYLTILFDFDGTLADTASRSLAIINSLAPEFGFAPIRPEELPSLRTMSARRLLTERAGIPLWNIAKISRLERRVRENLASRSGEIAVFPSIPDMMRNLYSAGYELGVVSSNSEHVIRDVLTRNQMDVHFIHAGSKFFGKARAIRSSIRYYGIDKSRAVYIGDEIRDVEACKKVGIEMLAVGWGLNAADALKAAGVRVAETPNELLSILTRT
jgi:phosphoglycolate phosphatase